MATLEEEYKNYQQTQGTDQINDMYDAQKQAQLASLESAYNQNMSNAQAARDALPAQYQSRANDLAVQYERQRRNLNQQAAANGLNTGAGSQMQLALGSNYNRDYGGIRTAQQQAIDQADRGIRDLQSAYQSSVQQAVANNDYQRAQALLAEYKNQYQRQLQQAQTLASYGIFSGYNGIPGYTEDQISGMQKVWAASNPQLAYNTGAISADDYYRMTGQWPAGYTPPSSGKGWSWSGDDLGEEKSGSISQADINAMMKGNPNATPANVSAYLQEVYGYSKAQADGMAQTAYYASKPAQNGGSNIDWFDKAAAKSNTGNADSLGRSSRGTSIWDKVVFGKNQPEVDYGNTSSKDNGAGKTVQEPEKRKK